MAGLIDIRLPSHFAGSGHRRMSRGHVEGISTAQLDGTTLATLAGDDAFILAEPEPIRLRPAAAAIVDDTLQAAVQKLSAKRIG